MAQTCTITGVLRRPSGAPLAGAALRVLQPSIRATWDGAAMPVVASATSDGGGAIALTLIPGFYTLVWQDEAGAVQAGMLVPDAATADLSDVVARPVLVAPNLPEPVAPYDNDTCRVVGTLRRPSGAIMAATAIHLVQDTIRRAWDGAALPVVQTVVSDGNGVVDFPLIPGHYRLVWQDAAGQAEHRLWVPDAPFVWLADAARGHETPWSPMFLFAGGEEGFWPGGFDPAAGRVYQTSAGDTPTESFEQPAGLVERAWGTADAVQTVSAARPTMARWPKGGRRNLFINTEFSTGNSSGPRGGVDFVPMSGFDNSAWYKPNVDGYAYNIDPDGVAGDPLTERTFSTYIKMDDLSKPPLSSSTNSRPSNLFVMIGINAGGWKFEEDLGDGLYRISSSGRGPSNKYNIGPVRYTNNRNPELTFRVTGQQFDRGLKATPYQKVTTANDVTEEGVPSIYHLYNDGGDSLPVTLPSDTYGVAWVDPYGEVQFGAETGSAINALPGERVVDSIVRQGAFTPAEEQQITDYWEGLYK